MTENELLALLRLQRIPNVGEITAKKLIAHCGGPEAIFDDKKAALEKIKGIGPLTIKGLYHRKFLREAELEMKYIIQNKIRVETYTDPTYPSYLKHCPDSPLLLFKKGTTELRNKKVIAVVGTRNMTSYGREFCESFIADISVLQPVIVSGFAYGVDICVQRAALQQGIQTVACLAHGLNQIYPSAHATYSAELLENGGFYTEFWSSSKPERENFLKRNRIIAGMSQATVVVESAERGGSLVTADLAVGYNRDVFALPGRNTDPFSLGCNNLIKQQKAHLITSAADLMYIMGWSLEDKVPDAVQKKLYIELIPEEKAVYEYLLEHGKQLLDTIAIQTGLPVFKTASILLNMEMKGVIRPLPGKLFEAV